MTIRDHLRRLLPVIDRGLNTTRDDIRFAIVIWEDGGQGPLFSAGNYQDPELIKAMLEQAAMLQLVGNQVAGHA